MRVLIELITYNGVTFVLFVLIPWALGIAIVLDIFFLYFWNKLWKGMEKEKRYMYIKVAKW